MIRTALHSGAFLLLMGCMDDGAKITVVQGPHGDPVQVLEMAGTECPDVFDKGVSGGCATLQPIYVIFYPRDDENARNHELEHVQGMRHTMPWQAYGNRSCVRVTATGRSTWNVGDLICRESNGGYSRG